jgi:hypothetical protein
MVFVNTVMNLRVPQNAGKFLSGCTIGGFSRRTQLRKMMMMIIIIITITTIFWDITLYSPLKVKQSICFHAGILLGLLGPEDGGEMFLRNVV